MSPPATDAPGATRSWLLRQPEWVATVAFMVGTLAGASALGVAAISAEGQGYGPGDIARSSMFFRFTVLTTLGPVLVWGLVVGIALWLRRGLDVGLVVVASVAMTAVMLFAAMISGGPHGQSTMLCSMSGLIVAVLLDALRIASFLGVARRVKRLRDGDAEQDALDVAAAAWGWALGWSLIGTLVGPGVAFQIPAALMLVAALTGLASVHALASRRVDEEPPTVARDRARGVVLRGLRAGALPLAIAGALFVPLRLFEQLSTTRNPAVMAIFQSPFARHCDVAPAGREGEISLWLIQCSSPVGRTIGWDEREHVLLTDEKLFERVPRLRSAPPAGSASSR
jgi:hypothetical protein